ncbi:unnamed protein product [Urochloa humidicola]
MGRTKQSSFWSSRRRASSAPATPRPEPTSSSEPPIGCMSMVHYLIFAPGAGCVGRPPASSNAIVSLHGGDLLSPDRRDGGNGSSKKSGFEAPRNSLDLDADNANDIQIGVQIEPVFDALARTGMRRCRPTAPSSEAETPRTPSLVARLMGIDGLPDNPPSPSPAASHKARPSSAASKKHADADKENYYHCSSPARSGGGKGGEKKKRVIPESMNRREPLRSLSCNVGGEARSLPETPRASWDGPRLSLQALKETVLDRAAQYMSMASSPTSAGGKKKKDGGRRRRDEKDRERVAKEHAREILRQAKENVATRKAAAASSSSSPATDKRRSRFGSSNKENVPSPPLEDKVVVAVHGAAGKPTVVAAAKAQEYPRAPLAPRQPPPPPPPHRAKPSRPPPPPPPLDPPTRARKPDGCERFATRIKKPSASVVGGHPPPPPASSSSSPTVAALPLSAPPATSASSASVVGKQQRQAPPPQPPLEEDPEYVYLRAVLERGGFMRPSPPPLPRRPFLKQGHSPPVDPIVFHLLELELPAEEARLGPLRHRWNRKLLFHLAQELLADLALPPLDGASPLPPAMVSVSGTQRPRLPLTGVPLLGKVWRKVRGYPAADCRVVGDIDALVASDLGEESPAAARVARHPAVEEEAADVAEEVADRVLDALLGESLSHLCACA